MWKSLERTHKMDERSTYNPRKSKVEQNQKLAIVSNSRVVHVVSVVSR